MLYLRLTCKKLTVNCSKVYFMDTGLVCCLTGWYTAEQLQFGAMSGNIFETFVVTEILRVIKIPAIISLSGDWQDKMTENQKGI